ncbi:MAG: methionyl-tRNA formyltransferase [Rhodothermales bacterium]
MKISFICNSFLALPSAQLLHEASALAGLATSSKNLILSEQMARFAAEIEVPYTQITPESIASDIKEWIQSTNPDAVLVQTFPHLIPATCLDLPPLGFYNIHPSPLPAYRGPDPIFWQLAHNEKTCGVTLHKMGSTFDTGPILHIESIPVDPKDTYGLVQSNLSFAAVEALKYLLSCANPEEQLVPQTAELASTQAKPHTQDLIIEWADSPAHSIEALVRACNPHQNGAITFFRDVMTRVLEANLVTLDRVPKLPAGSVIAADDERGLLVICSDELALQLNLLHVEEGYYTGRRFCEVFKVGLGEKFCNPAFLS